MATKLFTPTTSLTVFCLLSLLSHAIAWAMLSGYGEYEFIRPADLMESVSVELPPTTAPPRRIPASPRGKVVPARPRPATIPPAETAPHRQQSYSSAEASAPLTTATALPASPFPAEEEVKRTKIPEPVLTPVKGTDLPNPIRTNAEFVKGGREKLSYLISIHGLPVGTARLEATNRGGEVRITTSARSNGAIAMIYPVDNMTETRMFNGRYIMTTIRQREGGLHNDFGFTINLGEKNVFWSDRLKQRHGTDPVPTDQVVDIMSGLFWLRNQPLEVGRTVVVHLYDSNSYAATDVHVLRKERLSLAGASDVDTLVIQPELTTDGFFRRGGELLVWLTDDQFKVPVKMETTVVPLGRVTVELVSAEVER